jgi:hypothetical protein
MMHQGNEAGHAAMSNLVGMSGIAAGSMQLALGIARAIDAANDIIYDHRYNTSLEAAHAHAYQMEYVAKEAMKVIARLEAENQSLRAACQQRGEHIRKMRKCS